MSVQNTSSAGALVVTMQVIPVDGMLLILSGAHDCSLTRNIFILTDSVNNTSVGEMPDDKLIRQTQEDGREQMIGKSIALRPPPADYLSLH